LYDEAEVESCKRNFSFPDFQLEEKILRQKHLEKLAYHKKKSSA